MGSHPAACNIESCVWARTLQKYCPCPSTWCGVRYALVVTSDVNEPRANVNREGVYVPRPSYVLVRTLGTSLYSRTVPFSIWMLSAARNSRRYFYAKTVSRDTRAVRFFRSTPAQVPCVLVHVVRECFELLARKTVCPSRYDDIVLFENVLVRGSSCTTMRIGIIIVCSVPVFFTRDFRTSGNDLGRRSGALETVRRRQRTECGINF